MRFPLNAAVRSGIGDMPEPLEPKLTVGVFDGFGYWVTFSNGRIELPGDMLDLGLEIAALANAAYEQGRRDQAAAVRDALDYGREPL